MDGAQRLAAAPPAPIEPALTGGLFLCQLTAPPPRVARAIIPPSLPRVARAIHPSPSRPHGEPERRPALLRNARPAALRGDQHGPPPPRERTTARPPCYTHPMDETMKGYLCTGLSTAPPKGKTPKTDKPPFPPFLSVCGFFSGFVRVW
jgi:hypothetical protein